MLHGASGRHHRPGGACAGRLRGLSARAGADRASGGRAARLCADPHRAAPIPGSIDLLQRNVARARGASDKPISVLALSGGGADGAYGAGVLVGLDPSSGTRPEFQVVTGVSTGALIAPFAFLGPDWDGKLEEAFTGPAAGALLSPRGFGALLFGPSVYRGRPLERLVGHYVDDALLQAVARENARGRKLLVATTDLDRQETVIWNMGEIAASGGPQARRLFRDVLVASASVPGVFPPKLIEVRDGGRPSSRRCTPTARSARRSSRCRPAPCSGPNRRGCSARAALRHHQRATRRDPSDDADEHRRRDQPQLRHG